MKLRRLRSEIVSVTSQGASHLCRSRKSLIFQAIGTMDSATPTLGAIMQNIRKRNNWTLREMSAHCGVPVSTLSKVEHDRLTLTYDKLQRLSQRLGMSMSELFAEAAPSTVPLVTARRSIGLLETAMRVTTGNYDYFYLCTELRQKLMIPIITRIRTKTLSEFGSLVRHQGEEFVYVIEGSIEVHTEFYDPIILQTGGSIYIDSNMGHAYIAAKNCDEAVILGVCASNEQNLIDSLIELTRVEA